VECEFSYGGLECDDLSTGRTKAQICTDFRIYDCILFNLLSNAVNHCPSNSKVTIKIGFEEFDSPAFSGKLWTEITNDGSFKDLKNSGGDLNFKTFQIGEPEMDDERFLKTVGIGLSTSEALSSHMGGELHLKSIKNLSGQSVATKVKFSVLTCTKENFQDFSASVNQFKLLRPNEHSSAFNHISRSLNVAS